MNREEIAKKMCEIFDNPNHIRESEECWLAIADWHIAEIEKAEKHAKQEGYDQAMKDCASKVEEAEKRARREVGQKILHEVSYRQQMYPESGYVSKVLALIIPKINKIITANSDTERSE